MTKEKRGSLGSQNDALAEVLRYEAELLRLEESHDLLEWREADRPVWPLLKTSFLTYAIELRCALEGRQFQHIMRRYAPLKLEAILHRIRSSNERTPHASGSSSNSLFVISRARLLSLGNVLISPLFDRLRLDPRVADPEVWLLGDEMSNASRYIFEGAHVLGSIYPDLSAQSTPISCRWLESSAGRDWLSLTATVIGFSQDRIRALVRRHIAAMLGYEAVFFRLLAGREGRTLWLDSFGYPLSVGLVAAARRRGMIVIELQHGIQRWTEMLPDAKMRHHLATPDALMPLIDGLAPTTTSAPRIPITSLTQALPAYSSRSLAPAVIEVVSRALEESETAVRALGGQAGSGRRIVLVSHQGVDNLDWLLNALRQGDRGSVVWLRLRNGDERVARRFEGVASVEYRVPTSAALHHLLALASLHITNYSAVTLEAAASGLPTLGLLPAARGFASIGALPDNLFRTLSLGEDPLEPSP